MSPLLALTIATWVWILLAAVAIIAATFVVIGSLVGEEWSPAALGLLAVMASSGFLYGSVYMAGYPLLALWSWRISSGLTLFMGIICTVAALKDFAAEIGERLAVAAITAFSVLPLVCSIFANPVSYVSRPQSTVVSNKLVIVSEISLWHNVALIVVGIGTAMFLILFLYAVRRGIAPGIESHWGGLGGGLSGWQISLSLTYFIGSVIFGALFSLLAFRGDNASSGNEVKVSAPAQGASGAQPKTASQSG